MTTARLGVRIRGGLPLPIPTGRSSIPDIPMPALPDWWKAAGPKSCEGLFLASGAVEEPMTVA
jgi:hypothetical protein